MHTRHRLYQFRKSKHVLHQRFRSRIFYRDIMAVAELKKPFVVVLTGAGISAESGIRTFRTVDGLWEQHPVEDVATPEGYQRDPVLVQEFYNARRRQLQAAEVRTARWQIWKRGWGKTSCWLLRISITCMNARVTSGCCICMASC